MQTEWMTVTDIVTAYQGRTCLSKDGRCLSIRLKSWGWWWFSPFNSNSIMLDVFPASRLALSCRLLYLSFGILSQKLWWVLSFTQAHLCNTPFCIISRDSCVTPKKLKEKKHKSFSILPLQVSRDMKSIAAWPRSGLSVSKQGSTPVSKQGSTPTPWARGSARQNPKKGAPDTEDHSCSIGFTVLRGDWDHGLGRGQNMG